MGFKHDNVILTREGLEDAVRRLEASAEFAIDTETRPGRRRADGELVQDDALDPHRNAVIWVSVAVHGWAAAIPCGHPNGHVILPKRKVQVFEPDPKDPEKLKKRTETRPPLYGPPPPQIPPGDLFEALRPVLFSERRKIGANIKFDMKTVAKYYDGEVPPGPYGDVQAAFRLVDENYPTDRLKPMVKRVFKYTYEQLGKRITDESLDNAASYARDDAMYTWLLYRFLERIIENLGIRNCLDLDQDCLPGLARAELRGTRIDREQLDVVSDRLDREIDAALAQLYIDADRREWNPNSDADVAWFVYDHCKNPVTVRTKKTQAPSTAKGTIEKIAEKDERVQHLLDWRELDKMRGTYVHAIAERMNGDALGTNFKISGAATGRLSCVSGATLLPTTRGTFRFDEYVPQEGDQVLTHRGRLRPVLRKIYKGREVMHRLVLSDGSTVECTDEHRLLTPTGWKRVADIHVGSEVYGERVDELGGGRGERASHAGGVPRGGQAHAPRSGGALGHHLPQRAVRGPQVSQRGHLPVREGVAVLALEAGREEPHVGQEWFPTPQPQGGRPRRVRVPAAEGGREVRLRPSTGGGRGAGASGAPRDLRRAPHRREQDQQRPGQPRPGDAGWPSADSRTVLTVRDRQPLGEMGVWDIEVAEDHSYAAQGLLHHNSSGPNLQNIPRPGDDPKGLGTIIRGMFIARPAHRLIVSDYGQIEYRVMAHLSGDPTYAEMFRTGIDPHVSTAQALWGIDDPGDVTKEQRNGAKNTGFAIAYGAWEDKVASMSGISIPEARDVMARHAKTFPRLYEWIEEEKRKARKRKHPYYATMLGRRRRLPAIRWGDQWEVSRAERQGVNHIVQGSAAEIMKMALVNLDLLLEDGMHLLLTVHDEVVVEAEEGLAERAAELVREAMAGEAMQTLDVPLVADPLIVDRWSEAK